MGTLKARRTPVHLGDAMRAVERLQVTPDGRGRDAQFLCEFRHGNGAGFIHLGDDPVQTVLSEHRLLLLGIHDSPIGTELGHKLHDIGSVVQKR